MLGLVPGNQTFTGAATGRWMAGPDLPITSGDAMTAGAKQQSPGRQASGAAKGAKARATFS